MYNTTTWCLKETYFGFKDTKRLKRWKRYSMKTVTEKSWGSYIITRQNRLCQKVMRQKRILYIEKNFNSSRICKNYKTYPSSNIASRYMK